MQTSLLTYILIGFYGIFYDAQFSLIKDAGDVSGGISRATGSQVDFKNGQAFSELEAMGVGEVNGTLGQQWPYSSYSWGDAYCSRRYPSGMCWRYCHGNSGDYCYTSTACDHDVKCQALVICNTKCTYYSDYGCVESCPPG